MKISKLLTRSFVSLLVTVLLVFSFTTTYASQSSPTNDRPKFDQILSVTGSKIHYSMVENYGSISCIGTIKNTSKYTWEEIVVEAQFFNESGELIDTITEQNYDLKVSPHGEVTFKIKDDADRQEKEYFSHKARITYAKIDNCSTTRNSSNQTTLTKIIVSWAPMLLLIFVWVFAMWKYSKKSPQTEMVKIMQNNSELIEKQNQLFEKLVNSIQEHTKNKEK